MGLFDFLKGGGVNKNIQQIEERKKRLEKQRAISAQNEIEREKRITERKLTEKKKNDYLTSFNSKIMCEDGVERNYYGKNLGIILEAQEEKGEPHLFKRIENLEDQGIPYYFKSYKRGDFEACDTNEVAHLTYFLINEKWLSKKGKYLKLEQILTRNEIEQVEHNYHIKHNLDYKKYIEWENRPIARTKPNYPFGYKRPTESSYHYIFKINNIFLVYQGKVKTDVRKINSDGVDCWYPKELFTGIIDGVKYINGKEII
jgi:hypothetical protein